MIRFFTPSVRDLLTRREWLRIGGLAGLASLAPRSSALATENSVPKARGFGRARSVIFVYASGGQSQLEMWDPKPDAPESVRGEFKAIRTSVPGVLLGEHMPQLARLADRYTIVRSLSHDDLDHGSAGYLALTGRPHPQKSSNPRPRPTDEPTYGAVLKRVRPIDSDSSRPHPSPLPRGEGVGRPPASPLREGEELFPYEAVHLNGPALVPFDIGPGQDGGYLGRRYEPLVLGDVSAGAQPVPDLTPHLDLPAERLAARETLRDSVERAYGRLEARLADGAPDDMNRLYRQAFEVLASPRCRQAFDLSAEPEWLRDRYGRNRSGQACLLARRLVEAGVPLITVIWSHSNRGQDREPTLTDAYGWDTHNDIFEALRVHLLPRFDQGFSALLEDLDARGLLDQTLVVCMGEFGRAPRVALEPTFAGRTPGRKHWASTYSAVLAGAGVARGATYGSSDRFAAQPVTDRVFPWDVAATMFWALGIDPATEYHDLEDRPRVVSLGQPIHGLFG
ncbi:MAG TPA: DUF1501 domain-containing protein [Pirellulales bacterium]|nr:DUF1501 domain-containing protein [Pirellulales bacterium]